MKDLTQLIADHAALSGKLRSELIKAIRLFVLDHGKGKNREVVFTVLPEIYEESLDPVIISDRKLLGIKVKGLVVHFICENHVIIMHLVNLDELREVYDFLDYIEHLGKDAYNDLEISNGALRLKK